MRPTKVQRRFTVGILVDILKREEDEIRWSADIDFESPGCMIKNGAMEKINYADCLTSIPL